MRLLLQEKPCRNCGKPVFRSPKTKHMFYTNGKAYCCTECMLNFSRVIRSETMARTNRLYASKRMTDRNPMRVPSVREKVKNSLRRIGHKPRIRGGNGTGPTRPEKLLINALKCEWNVVVKTGAKRGTGYPYNYKIDLGFPSLKIGIEVDGNSHSTLSRKAQDMKKQEFLEGIGWTILRFTNKQVMEDLEGCVQTVLSTTSK